MGGWEMDDQLTLAALPALEPALRKISRGSAM